MTLTIKKEVEHDIIARQALIRATLNDDVKEVQQAIQNGASNYEECLKMAIQYHRHNVARFLMSMYAINATVMMELACKCENVIIAQHLYTNYGEPYNMIQICTTGNLDLLDLVIHTGQQIELCTYCINALFVNRRFDFVRYFITYANTDLKELVHSMAFCIDFDLELSSLNQPPNYTFEDSYEILFICVLQTDLVNNFDYFKYNRDIQCYMLNRGVNVKHADAIIQLKDEKQTLVQNILQERDEPLNDWPNIAKIVTHYIPFEKC